MSKLSLVRVAAFMMMVSSCYNAGAQNRLPLKLKDPDRAADTYAGYGKVSFPDKTIPGKFMHAGGLMYDSSTRINEVFIPGGEYEMGDHNGHYDPGHPNDEIPVHLVRIDSMYMSKTETTNEQFLAFLTASLSAGTIQVTANKVHLAGDTGTLYYTNQYASYYSIGFDGAVFSMADFRASHPVNGIMWSGAAVYCNWLSAQNGLQPCYDLSSWNCDFTSNGYRLPTEAEWEYAARGGHTDPYLKFENGNTVDINQANLPNSGDPYETGPYPMTTPVGFYDGTLKYKPDYNWPGNTQTYQTSDGINGFGLYDMQGNVWEFVNDWYGSNYYEQSPYDNPKGPDTGSIMPDGKSYRGMRGGNWYNGIDSNGVNDGHSRVSNRDPSYFRGPQDPYHPWYHVGFRVMRQGGYLLGVQGSGDPGPENCQLNQNYPNPFSQSTMIRYFIPGKSHVLMTMNNVYNQELAILINHEMDRGWHSFSWDGSHFPYGIYFCTLSDGLHQSVIKMIVVK